MAKRAAKTSTKKSVVKKQSVDPQPNEEVLSVNLDDEMTTSGDTVQNDEQVQPQKENLSPNVSLNSSSDEEGEEPTIETVNDTSVNNESDEEVPTAKDQVQQPDPKPKKAAAEKNIEKIKFAKRGGSAADKKKPRSVSKRAGLIFPVTRIRNNLKKFVSKKLRIQAGAACYLAATLEYLVVEMFELSSEIALKMKKIRIIPRHLLLAIKRDDELDQLLQHVTIAQGGVMKTVHPALLPKNSKSNKTVSG
jgi:histone H2A